MGIIGFILLIIALAYLIYDDRKRFAELRKFKKLMRKARREACKESWQRIRNCVAKPRNAAHENGELLKETKLYHGVILEFSFPEYRQGNLDFINETLSQYALKDVTVTDHTGALVRSENGDGQYALKSCTLKCDLMPSGPGLDFRLSTMAAAKTVRDCGLLWQQKHPDRKLCRKVFRELGIAYALVVVHHDKAMHLPKREIIPSPGQHTRAFQEKKDPREPFTLEYHFKNRRETDLDQINADLAKYELSELELAEYKGYLGTVLRTYERDGEKTVRYWYGLDDCVLRCTPAKPGKGQYYRINTMTMEKTTGDCADLWRTNNPDRTMRTMVELSFPEVRAIVVLHHKKAESPVVSVPASVPVPSKKTPPVRSDSKTKYCCGRPGKDTLDFRYEDGTLDIEGQGRLRCGQWPWLTAPIRHVVIGSGCTAIGAFVFLHCRSLETIVLPDTLRTIGEKAFAYCTNLREVTIPDSVTGISKGAFDHCENLARVYLPRNLTQNHPHTFCCCVGLQDVQIPDSVHYIGTRAFYRVKSVKNLPRNLGNFGTRSPGYSKRPYGLGEEAFAYAGLPDHIEIPDRIHTLPESVFWGCKTLVSVTLPRCLREVGESAFGSCSSLTGITLPEGVTKINRGVFLGCTSLTGIMLPKGVTEIGAYAFSDCTNLTDIMLPEGVAEIGEYAFEQCKSLVSLELPGSVTKLGKGVFARSGIVKAVFPGNIAYIPQAFFSRCRNLQSVVLPDELIGIGRDAFEKCGSLEKIRIPDKVTFIGERAFHSCVKLTSLKLPESLTRLDPGAFACCSGLTEMVIPSGITCISRSTFVSCTGLTSVTIPDSVTEIHIWGFANCTALKDLYIPATVNFIGTSAFTDVPGIIYHGPSEGLNNWGALSLNGIPTERKPVTINQILWENKRCNDYH